MAKQQVLAHPLLHDLERLIDSAWAAYAAAQAGASAVQATSGTTAAHAEQPSPRLTASGATDTPARQEPAVTVCPTQPTLSVATAVIRSGKADGEARAMLQRLDAMLVPLKVADLAPPVQSPDTQKLLPTR